MYELFNQVIPGVSIVKIIIPTNQSSGTYNYGITASNSSTSTTVKLLLVLQLQPTLTSISKMELVSVLMLLFALYTVVDNSNCIMYNI